MIKRKNIICLIMALVCCCVFSMSATAFASEEGSSVGIEGESLVEEIPIDYSLGRGVNPPTTDNVHNVYKSDYIYQINTMGYQLYTAKWLTGKTKMKVTVNNWKQKSGNNNVNNKLTLTIYNSSKKAVTSKVLTMKKGVSNSYTFTGLSKAAKYYIGFKVPKNGNTYSFDGKVI